MTIFGIVCLTISAGYSDSVEERTEATGATIANSRRHHHSQQPQGPP